MLESNGKRKMTFHQFCYTQLIIQYRFSFQRFVERTNAKAETLEEWQEVFRQFIAWRKIARKR